MSSHRLYRLPLSYLQACSGARRTVWTVGATIFLELAVFNSGQAQSFRVAHSSQGFIEFSSAGIDDSGAVVFSATKNGTVGNVTEGVYLGAGGMPAAILETELTATLPPGQIAPTTADRNNLGEIALLGFDASGFFQVLAGRGPLSSANLVGSAGSARSVEITDGNFIHVGGTLRSLDPNFGPNVGPCSQCFGIMVNKRNQLLVVETDNANATHLSVVRVGITNLPPPRESTRFLAPIATNELAIFPGGVRTGPFLLNDNGAVAYQVFSADGSSTINISPGTGPGSPVVHFRSPAAPQNSGPDLSEGFLFGLNNRGEVAFFARSRTYPGRPGIFRGPNALSDKIVLENDLVDGTPLFRIELPKQGSRRPFNNRGQVVVTAADSTGSGLWVIDSAVTPPAPKSTAVEWIGPAAPAPGPSLNGQVGDPTAWKPLNGDPPRVPQKTPKLNDVALFDRADQYTVTLDSAVHAGRLLVKNGQVTFSGLSPIQVDELSFDEPSLTVDNARLILALDSELQPLSSMVTCNHALIGESGAARVDVTAQAEWLALGSLRVGGRGEGRLTVEGGGEVASGEARIGGTAGGHASVGPSGKWTTGNLAVGIDGGVGDLTVHDGGEVVTRQAVIGKEPGLGNFVKVAGVASNPVTSPARWHADSVSIGSEGTGRLEIRDGGSVDAVLLQVAEQPSATGSVTVSGVSVQGSATNSSSLFLGRVVVGAGGLGELAVEAGGTVQVLEDAVLGGFSTGNATVSGRDAATSLPASLEVGEGLHVGDLRPASLLVEDGAEVKSKSGVVLGYAPGSTSEARVVGLGSSWTIEEELSLGDAAAADQDDRGFSVLTLVNSSVQAGAASLYKNAVIRGFGTLAIDPANRLVNSNGTISPGLSPGTITLNGNYEQLSGGRLLIEIAGTNTAAYDQLVVSQTATLDGEVTFRFLNGFAPKSGDTFDFLRVGGKITGGFARAGLQNLAPGFQFVLATNGSAISMKAANDGAFSTALPGTVTIQVTNVSGLTYALALLATTNSCQLMSLDGPVTRTNNVFSQAVQATAFVGPDCSPQDGVVTHSLVLGALAPGDYQFLVTSGGDVVQSVPFTVPAVAENWLTPVWRPNGTFDLQVAGLPPVSGTVEVSGDLRRWVFLASGTLPFAVTNLPAVFAEQFFRARIGP